MRKKGKNSVKCAGQNLLFRPAEMMIPPLASKVKHYRRYP
jgi:hypothetical protein